MQRAIGSSYFTISSKDSHAPLSTTDVKSLISDQISVHGIWIEIILHQTGLDKAKNTFSSQKPRAAYKTEIEIILDEVTSCIKFDKKQKVVKNKYLFKKSQNQIVGRSIGSESL